MTKTINLINKEQGSICIDVTHASHIDDMIPMLKAILIWQGFAMQTIDDIFDEELRELRVTIDAVEVVESKEGGER